MQKAQKSKLPKLNQVVILAGGKGERLMPFTATMNKGMVKVAGKPFLEHLINLFKKNGLRRFLILTGHATESITDYFGNGEKFDIDISYHHAPPEWNHGKRLADALPFIDNFFLLHRNDIYWPFDINTHLKHFYKQGLPAMMTVHVNENKNGIYGPGSNVRLNIKGNVERYDPALSNDPFYRGQDLGFFLLNKQTILENLPASIPSNYCLHHELLSGLAEKGLLSAFPTEIPATTITDADWLKKAESYLKKALQRQH